MVLYLVKLLVSAAVIVAVTELSKRGGTFWGGLLASLPLTSLLAFLWLYGETHDSAKIASLSWNIFWLVLPSLSFFVALPLLLRRGLGFGGAMAISLTIMWAAYLGTAFLLRRVGVSI